MFEFCPHCGQFAEGVQLPGQVVACRHCGRTIGSPAAAAAPVVIRQADELIRQGTAAPCPACGQLVERRGIAFAPHFTPAAPRKLCPQSGKPVAPPGAPAPACGGKDLRALMTRDVVRLVSCRRGAPPRVEELTLEYLDKSDRVRLQIEALREMLGPTFRLCDYPAQLGRPQLAVWAGPDQCVVGKRHERGGYQALSDAEIAAVVTDLRQHAGLFFGE